MNDVVEEPEFPSPRIVDSRRLLGPNLYSVHEGAVLEVDFGADGESDIDRLIEGWRAAVLAACAELDWPVPDCVVHRILNETVHGLTQGTTHGAQLFHSAPIDALMTATALNEQAWVRAERVSALARSDDDAVPGSPGLDVAAMSRLRDAVETECTGRPRLRSLYAEARQRGVNLLLDDNAVSVGSGGGSMTWPVQEVPPTATLQWNGVRDVPIALVTGSNGKTTTTRLVAAMWRAAGIVAGWSCSDGVQVDDEPLDTGDFSGPAGARLVLRDARVRAAVLETARGGMLRRGLALQRAAAAIITNISADHFGEYGVESLRDLARVKAIVARAIGADGRLVLNADDDTLIELAPRLGAPLAWFSMREPTGMLREHVARGGDAAIVRDDRAWLQVQQSWHDLGAVADMPLALNGAAPHNIANLLGASLLAACLGVPLAAIRDTMHVFGASVADNPGRLQLQRFGGVTVLVDYAHNPDGLAALCTTAMAIPATRRLLLLGQAGNRDDAQLRALVQAACRVTVFDRVIIKEMVPMLRGRAIGDIPAVFADELARVGVPADRVERSASEFDAVQRAFAWATDGDVLVCPVHVDKERVLAWLAALRAQNWQPGSPFPP